VADATQPDMAEVQAQLTAALAANAELADDFKAVSSALDDLKREQADAAASAAAELEKLTAERDVLFDKLAKALKDKESAPKVKVAPAAKARATEAIDNPKPAELQAMIAAAGHVQLVFSDGKREILAVPARDITGNAWAVTVVGLALRVPELLISASGDAPVEISAYALFIDTKQVAFAKRFEPLRVTPGQSFNISNDVIFVD
jgi:hypothetical protein